MRNVNFYCNGIENKQGCFQYFIADTTYQFTCQIKELDSFKRTGSYIKTLKPKSNLGYFATSFHGKTQIGEKPYHLGVIYGKNSYQLTTEENTYSITENSIIVNANKCDIMVLLGPVLILNLALNNVFCLHASSFQINETLYILMADSGTGKSTIARYMDKAPNSFRVGDDILPVQSKDKSIKVFPQFPQLKLSSKKQYTQKTHAKKVKLLFAKKEAKTKLSKMDSFSSLKQILRHTVATKLFSPPQLKSHLDFCHQTIQGQQCYQVDYQHSTNGLIELYESLNEIS